MAEATQLAQKRIITSDGVVTATVLDRVSPDHIVRMLTKASGAAKYAHTTDDTDIVSRDIKDLLIFPVSES